MFENDLFVLKLGDHPELVHEPVKMGGSAGLPLGAYAIYRDRDDHILHRERMDAEQIATVRKKSRSPDGMLWTDFWDQAWKKTVIRRGFKALPVGEELDRIVRRDDDHYTFDGEAGHIEERKPLPPAVGSRRNGSARPAQVVSGTASEPPPVVGETDAPPEDEAPPETGGPHEPDEWLADYDHAQNAQEESADAEG